MTYILPFPEYITSNDNNARTIENYLLHGLPPGGFWQAMILNDLIGASCSADTWNREILGHLTYYMAMEFPEGSFGTRENYHNWMHDVNGCRSKYTEEMEKEFTIRSLKGDKVKYG